MLCAPAIFLLRCSQIISQARPSYEEGFQIISAQLPSIDEILTPVSLVRIGNNEAVYKASRNDDGIPMSFEVRFAMDVDGFWRVSVILVCVFGEERHG